MKKRSWRNLKTVLTIITVLVWLTTQTAVAKDRVVTDSTGNLLVFKAPPKKVVSLVPSATEILFEIGAGKAVSGLTFHDATLEGAEGKQVIGGFFQPSVEKINAIKPDFIILSDFHEQIRKELERSGYRIFVYDTDSIAQSYEMILAFGKMFDRQARARELVEKNNKEIKHIQKKLAKAVPGNRKRVIRLMGRDTVMTPGSDSFQNELITLAGGVAPDFGKKGSVVEVTKEEWLAFNPEVIYGCGGDKKASQAFFSHPGWKDVDAVKHRQIFYFPCELTCRAATNSGYFISWLASMIYTDEFADPQNDIFANRKNRSRSIDIDLDVVRSAAIHYSTIYDFENKTLMVDFKRPQTIVSTLEGRRDNILTVGNHYYPPPTWGPGHKMGIDHIRDTILKVYGKEKETASFLLTGADMDNLSVKDAAFKEMKVVALVTAGVMSNAVRMSQDVGLFYEPGTINIIIMTNMQLSKRAMTRAIITATEAKTAALEDMDIRSTATPLEHEATGTGTDNILVVQGKGLPIKNAGGHTKMGELIAKAVYAGMTEAILKQNKVTANRHIFQRLKERKISLYGLTSGVNCDCMQQKNITQAKLARKVEHLLLEKEYAAFIESAFALSDEYEKGLIKDLSLFNGWCRSVSSQIAGKPVEKLEDLLMDEDIPLVLKTALNAVFTGALEQLRND